MIGVIKIIIVTFFFPVLLFFSCIFDGNDEPIYELPIYGDDPIHFEDESGEVQFSPSWTDEKKEMIHLGFSLPTAIVTIYVVDIRGSVIKVFIDEFISGGGHEFYWDLTNENNYRVPNGIYRIIVKMVKNHKSKEVLNIRFKV